MADLASIVAEQTKIIQLQGQLITIKLNETNFLVWKQQVLAAARGYGLDGFLTGKHPVPEKRITASGKEGDNPAYATWVRQDQLLASWLLSSVSENILISTVGLNTSKEIWECLEVGFASQSRAKIMQFKLQLQTLKKGNLPMREYLNKVKICCDTLAAAGQKVSDEDQILHILSGLGNDYDSVMVSITSRVEPCSLREVYALLLSFEGRLENAEHTQINMDGSAININFAAQTYGGRRGGYPSYRGRGPGQQMQWNRGGRDVPDVPSFIPEVPLSIHSTSPPSNTSLCSPLPTPSCSSTDTPNTSSSHSSNLDSQPVCLALCLELPIEV
ncbi:hypothetical protein DH2020_026501 [Rehmannia glutinosa]|uniref:Retrotransposon Copia-like N-terminal domain-containing protein n=1 Tax=Rehmannia glutinosa TaxID=99300 RepID=A0ABR0VZJ2_REHGL